MNVDRNLIRYELKVANVWANELHAQGLISECERIAAVRETESILDASKGDHEYLELLMNNSDEDIHTITRDYFSNKGHTRFTEKYFYGRSRNDTSITLLQLWIDDLITDAQKGIISLASLALEVANRERKTNFISFTHERPSDVTLFGQYLIAYFYGLVRCFQRYSSIKPLTSCPLGVGAMAGSHISLDRNRIALQLGFDAPAPSGIYQVSSRDAATDFTYATSQLLCELNVIAQDLLFWSSTPRPLIILSEAISTGSVTSARKLSPTLLFEMRASYGTAIGELVKINTMRKGVCSGYCADLSLDKSTVYCAAELSKQTLEKAQSALRGISVCEANVYLLALSSKFEFLQQSLVDNYNINQRDMGLLIKYRCESKNNFGGDSEARVSETLVNAEKQLNCIKAEFFKRDTNKTLKNISYDFCNL